VVINVVVVGLDGDELLLYNVLLGNDLFVFDGYESVLV
jgi:hypothetical protein